MSVTLRMLCRRPRGRVRTASVSAADLPVQQAVPDPHMPEALQCLIPLPQTLSLNGSAPAQTGSLTGYSSSANDVAHRRSSLIAETLPSSLVLPERIEQFEEAGLEACPEVYLEGVLEYGRDRAVVDHDRDH